MLRKLVLNVTVNFTNLDPELDKMNTWVTFCKEMVILVHVLWIGPNGQTLREKVGHLAILHGELPGPADPNYGSLVVSFHGDHQTLPLALGSVPPDYPPPPPMKT